LQRIRSWFLNAESDFGYTYLNSLYTFSSTQEYGNTLSMTTIQSDYRILGVIGIDFKPLGSDQNVVSKNLLSLSDQKENRFEYFLLDPIYLNDDYSRTGTFTYNDTEWNLSKIAELLHSLIYTKDSKQDIAESLHKEHFKNIREDTVYYAELYAEGEDKLMFFSPWYLKMRPRDDRTKIVVGDVFVLISTEDFLENEKTRIQEDIYSIAILVSLLFGLFILVFGFMFSNWIANKYSGTIMKPISGACKAILEFNYSMAKQRN
jgi:hypothetical protein